MNAVPQMDDPLGWILEVGSAQGSEQFSVLS